MVAKYPAIPEPTLKSEALRDSVLTIKQAFEVLTGQRGNPDYRAVLLPELTALEARLTTVEVGAVRFDIAQSLTDAQVGRAQWNLRMGTATNVPASTDMDTLQVPGLYDVTPNSTNAPGGQGTLWWYLEIWRHSNYIAVSNDWMIQRATTLTEPAVQCWIRLNLGGGPWQAWHKFTLP
jgi:hypothetical protein